MDLFWNAILAGLSRGGEGGAKEEEGEDKAEGVTDGGLT